MPVNGGNQTVPTVVFPDGSAATNPSLAQVRDRLASTPPGACPTRCQRAEHAAQRRAARRDRRSRGGAGGVRDPLVA